MPSDKREEQKGSVAARVRNKGSVSSTEILPPTPERLSCVGPHGQHICKFLYEGRSRPFFSRFCSGQKRNPSR